MILLSALIVSVALVWAALQIVSEMRASRNRSGGHDRTMSLLALFAPAVAAAQQDPRALLAWQPTARAARQLYAEDFAALDRATGSTFPFSRDRIEAAHAQWTADWLAWELAHDTEYKLKAAVAEHELAGRDAARAAPNASSMRSSVRSSVCISGDTPTTSTPPKLSRRCSRPDHLSRSSRLTAYNNRTNRTETEHAVVNTHLLNHLPSLPAVNCRPRCAVTAHTTICLQHHDIH